LAAPDRQRHSLSALAAEGIVGGWPFPLDLRARAPRFKRFHQQLPAGQGQHLPEILILATKRDPKMSEKRGRGQPKFEPTQDQRGQVKQMKAL
jgi:hypothetical protein